MKPETIRSGLRTGALALLCAMILFIAATGDANAQDPRRGYNNGVAAQGTDMWTQALAGLRLFTPHRDNCVTASEVFVKVYTNSNSVDFGFCMDKDEHSAGSVEWENARQECLDDGKRLPEPSEFKAACQIGTGFSNMTDDHEWSSNFVTKWRDSFGSKVPGISTVASGAGSCVHAAMGWVGNSVGTQDTFVFRCVR